jgi:hypothetical protein
MLKDISTRSLATFGFALAASALVAVTVVRRSHADAHPGRYVIKPGLVYDTKTKLTWQQAGPSTPYTWAEAKTYCEALNTGGLTWRLPGIKELETLVDESRINPAIDPTAFPDAQGKFFWTASLVTNFTDSAWTVDFNRGGDNFFPTTFPELVRCVN